MIFIEKSSVHRISIIIHIVQAEERSIIHVSAISGEFATFHFHVVHCYPFLMFSVRVSML